VLRAHMTSAERRSRCPGPEQAARGLECAGGIKQQADFSGDDDGHHLQLKSGLLAIKVGHTEKTHALLTRLMKIPRNSPDEARQGSKPAAGSVCLKNS